MPTKFDLTTKKVNSKTTPVLDAAKKGLEGKQGMKAKVKAKAKVTGNKLGANKVPKGKK